MSLISNVLNAAAADPVVGPAYTKLAVRTVVEKDVKTGSVSVPTELAQSQVFVARLNFLTWPSTVHGAKVISGVAPPVEAIPFEPVTELTAELFVQAGRPAVNDKIWLLAPGGKAVQPVPFR